VREEIEKEFVAIQRAFHTAPTNNALWEGFLLERRFLLGKERATNNPPSRTKPFLYRQTVRKIFPGRNIVMRSLLFIIA
jgi:hypothetical protein